MAEKSSNVTLPQGVSLLRVAQVLVDAWEVGSHQWKETPLQLREGNPPAPPAPLPRDALELFRLLAERRVPYLLVGGIAMLTYVQGRNTKDIDLLMSVGAVQQVPELEIIEQKDFFARGHYRSVQVDLLLTTNPLFKLVQERFAARHSFEEVELSIATVEGLILLKLYALPSLYPQLDWDRVYVYESDVKQLIARYDPEVEPLLSILGDHVPASDLAELRRILTEDKQRRTKLQPPSA